MRTRSAPAVLTSLILVILPAGTLSGTAPLPVQARAGTGPDSNDSGLVRTFVVATDHRGSPVLDLTAADFELRVENMPHAVEQAELRTAGPRAFAILLDEFHVSASAGALVRDTLARFVGEQLRAGDLVSVLKPLDRLSEIRFSGDRDAALNAIAAFNGRKGDYTPRTQFERDYIGQDPDVARAARAQVVTSGLRELAAHLGRLPDARGAIVLISDGFAEAAEAAPTSRPVDAASDGSAAATRSGDRMADLHAAVRLARRLDVPVYGFAPGRGAGNLAADLRQASRDLDASYVLTWRPSLAPDGKFHPLEIRATRKGVDVRGPQHFRAPSPPMARTAGPLRTPQSLTMPQAGLPRRSPLIVSWLGFTPAPDGRARVTLTWEPRRGWNAASRGAPSLAVLHAVTSEGTPLFEGRISPVGAPGHAAALPSAVFEAPLGRIQLDLTILSGDGARLDFELHVLDLEQIGDDRPVILAPEVLRARTMPEFRALRADPDAAPVPSRQFFRTERLLIRVPAYGAGGAPLPVRAKLVNRAGQTMREIAPMAETIRGGITQFELPLASVWPGLYGIHFTVGGNDGEITERITFRVIG